MVFGLDDAAVIAGGAAIASAIGAGTGLAGGAMSNAANAAAAKDSFLYNITLQNLQNSWYRKYNDYARGTSHQFEVKDLIKSGLNPVLSGTGGSGASFSSGSNSAQSVQESSSPYNLDALSGIQLATDIYNNTKQTNSNVELQGTQAKLNDMNSIKSMAETRNANALTDKYANDIIRENALAQNTIDNNNAKTMAEINYMNEQAKYIPQQVQASLMSSQAAMSQANTSAKSYQLNRLQYEKNLPDIMRANAESQWTMNYMKKHPLQYGFSRWLGTYTQPIGQIFSGSASYGKSNSRTIKY